jgi:UPF0271 protein
VQQVSKSIVIKIKRYVDINCDLGEGQSLASCAQDALIMPYISRCNIACGAHAGNRLTMQKTLGNALSHGLICGAHPGYADKANFGRTSLSISIPELIESIVVQISELQQLANGLAINLSHVKLHGALYNDAEKSPELAFEICQMLASLFPNLMVLGLPHGAMQSAAQQHDLVFLREGFMDRAYLANGQLAARSEAGTVYENSEQCIAQLMSLLNGDEFTTFDNKPLKLQVDSICLHGDSKIAVDLARSLKAHLNEQNWMIACSG